MVNYVDKVRNKVDVLLPGLPEDLLDFYTLLVFVKGKECTLEDVHDAWSIWRNLTLPLHKSLIPFDELSTEVQELDRTYMLGIHQAASIDKHVDSR